jgi:putative DNA primase/helicase
MSGRNGDHTSKFSVIHGGLDVPKKSKRGWNRKPRLTGRQKQEAIRKGGGSSYARQAQKLEELVGKPIKIEEDKRWYLYSNGVWKYVGEKNQFRSLAWDVQGLDDKNSRTSKLIIESVIDRNHIKPGEEFCGCIRSDPTNDTTGENAYLINCPSGVLRVDFASGKVIEKIGHNPKFMFTSSLAVDYDPKAECPKFLDVASQILPDEKDRELLLWFFSYCIYPSCRLEIALFCVGSGGNGKSVLTSAIANVLGDNNRTSIAFKEICRKERKQIVRLAQILVNISNEVEVDPIKDSATFKQLVSGEAIETDRIYRDAVTIKSDCKYCLLSNHMPKYADGSNAEIRRTRIIEYSNTFEGDYKDVKLAEKLKGEKEGILRLLIEKLPQIASMDEMPYGGYESRMAQEAFSISNNPITAFIGKHIEITNNSHDYMSREHMYKLYCEFQKANNLEYLNDVHMLRQLYEVYPKLREGGNIMRTINDKRCRIVKYVKQKSAQVSTGMHR